MSVIGSDSTSIAQQSLVSNYILVASTVAICYDYIITIGVEVRLMWCWPLHIAQLTFLIPRYIALFSNIAYLIIFLNTTSLEVCDTAGKFGKGIFFASLFYAWCSQLWRVIALYNNDTRFIYMILPFFLAIMGFTMWDVISDSVTLDIHNHSCLRLETNQSSLRARYVSILSLVWELVALAITVAKTWKTAKAARSVYGRRFISIIMLRDGVMYFSAIALLSFSNILTLYINSAVLPKAALSWTVSCMAIVLTSRLFINLRENASAGIVSHRGDPHNTADIIMSDIVLRQLEDLSLK